MTTDQLRELEKRLSEAKGPDRQLDADIHVLLFQTPNEHYSRPFRHPILLADEHRWPGTLERVEISGVSACAAEKFTASLDAAVALVERVLGTHSREGEAMYSAGAGSGLYRWRIGEQPWCESETEALALCLAAIRAIAGKAAE